MIKVMTMQCSIIFLIFFKRMDLCIINKHHVQYDIGKSKTHTVKPHQDTFQECQQIWLIKLKMFLGLERLFCNSALKLTIPFL